MKLIFETKKLRKALDTASGLIASKVPRASARCARIQASNGVVASIFATDMETFLSQSVDAEVEKPHELLIPFQLLHRVVCEARSDTVEIFAEDNKQTTIIAGKSTFKLQCCIETDFPFIEVTDVKATAVLLAQPFARALRSVMVARDENPEASKQYLGGACLIGNGNRLFVNATSGREMAQIGLKASVEGDLFNERRIILPAKALPIIIGLCEQASEDAELKISAPYGKCSFEIPGATCTTALIDSVFPHCESVLKSIKADCDKEVSFKRDLLDNALKQCAILMTENENGFYLELSKDRATLRASSEPGEGSAKIEVLYDGKDFRCKLNLRSIQKALSVIDAPSINMQFSTPNKAVLFVDDSLSYVVMPQNLETK